MTVLETLRTRVEEKRDQIIEMQRDLTAVPALAPQNGGTGEWEKSQVLARWLSRLAWGPASRCRHPTPACRAASARTCCSPYRAGPPTGHSGSCPTWTSCRPGEASLWESDPYTLVVKGDRLIGRGVEDNQQGLVSSVIAALCVKEAGLQPTRTVKLLFVADEETGWSSGSRRW